MHPDRNSEAYAQLLRTDAFRRTLWEIQTLPETKNCPKAEGGVK